jgi:hypothetical protein
MFVGVIPGPGDLHLQEWHYQYSGLQITSEIQLPEWSVFEIERLPGDCDVHLALKTAPDEAPASGEVSFVVEAQRYQFRVQGVGSYHVENGRTVTVEALPGAGAPELRLFLLGSAWSALCYQRGMLPIHGSVVQVGGGAVAFSGPSGAGKSSTAAWLAQRGFGLVSDDLCVVDFSRESRPCVWPSTGRLKLWDSALDALGKTSDGLQRDHFRTEKFHLPWPTAGVHQTNGAELDEAVPVKESNKGTVCQPVPLRAFYLLEWGETGLTRLTGSEALRRLIAAATYRGDLVEPTSGLADHWEQFTRLTQDVPVWEFRRPQDWSGMNEAMNMLQDQWR